jgi:hypothetical protein
MYKKGDLVYGFHDYDSREDEDCVERKSFILPHSCDEWVIGGKEELEQLIKDAQELLLTNK